MQEEECLGLLLERPALWAEVFGILTEGDFTGAESRALYAALAAAAQADPALDTAQFVAEQPQTLQDLAGRARTRVAQGSLPDGQVLARYVAKAAYRLKRTRLNEERAELTYLQREAERSGDIEAARMLLKRQNQLMLQERALDKASGLHG